MNPLLLLNLLNNIVALGTTMAGKPNEAGKITSLLGTIMATHDSLTALSDAVMYARKEDGTIDAAGWDAIHAQTAKNRARLEDLLA